ncbi:phage head-tail joining protein [Roseibium sp.]|uniref:phage head-tail joining protein n=1 Tax=Roseibium sp. TaxID=1936156 RepID=UPI003BA8E529
MSTIDDGLTVEEKRALLKELKEAIFSGALKIRFREREVTYRSLEEMRKIVKDIEGELGGKPKRKHVILTTFSRGR